MELKRVDEIIDSHKTDKTAILAILQDVQEEARWLSKETLEAVSKRMDIPLSNVYHMATFFEAFHLKPRGEHVCTVCMGTACHVRGAQRLVEEAERDLAIASGETTEDLSFTLEEVNCVGACALGPLVIMDNNYHGSMTPDKLRKLIKRKQKSEGSK